MSLVVVLVLLVVVSLVFHFASPWSFTPLASNWGTIDTTVTITLCITGLVFVAVNLFMALAIYRYRHQPTRRAHYEPENRKLESWLTVITAIGVAAMLAPGLVVWAHFIDVPDDAHEIEVLGQQWEWRYRLPGADGVLGRAHNRFIGPDNSFGLDPTDERGLDDLLVSSVDLHLPLDRPVKVLLRSKDVLHNFAVPQFRVKMDLVPGLVSYLWFTPTRTGRFDILCMELCGVAHYTMRGQVVVESAADFANWLAEQPTWAQTQGRERGDPERGQGPFALCTACHGQHGEGNAALAAPRLAGLPSWYLERQIHHYQQGIRGAHAQDPHGQQMAQIVSTLTDEAAIRDLSAYIETLDVAPTGTTLAGNAERGAQYYRTCASCHGAGAEGNAALNAPRLAGQQDWYLKRQLAHFREGIRGADRRDRYGQQMMLMARTLQGDQVIDDLLAYLSQL